MIRLQSERLIPRPIKTQRKKRKEVRDARNELVMALKSGEAFSEDSFRTAISQAPQYLYHLFTATREIYDKTGLVRICGNPATTHLLGTLFNVHDHTELRLGNRVLVYPYRHDALAVAILHDLGEDCGAESSDLEKILSEASKKSGTEIPGQKQVIECCGLLRKPEASNGEKMARYDEYLQKIVDYCLEQKSKGIDSWATAEIVKQGDSLDNLDTSRQIEDGEKLPDVLKKTRMNVEKSSALLDAGFDPFIYSLQEANINSAILTINYAKSIIEEKVKRIHKDVKGEKLDERYGEGRFNVHYENRDEHLANLRGLRDFFLKARYNFGNSGFR